MIRVVVIQVTLFFVVSSGWESLFIALVRYGVFPSDGVGDVLIKIVLEERVVV